MYFWVKQKLKNMKKESQSTISKIVSSPLWIFSMGILAIIGAFKDIIDTKEMIHNNISLSDLPIFSLSFFESIMQIVIVFVLYFIYKAFLKQKKDIEFLISEINNGFIIVTDNLNHSHRINDLKIRYVDFRIENKDLTNEEFIDKINKYGFSKEDLEDIGVDKLFTNKQKERLLPRVVMDKYVVFKNELNNHIENKLNDDTRNI